MFLTNKRKIDNDANQTSKSRRLSLEQENNGLNEIYGLRQFSVVKQWLNGSEENDVNDCESFDDQKFVNGMEQLSQTDSGVVLNSVPVEGSNNTDVSFNKSFESEPQAKKIVEKSLSESSLRNSKRLSETTERSEVNLEAEEAENSLKSAEKSENEPRVSERTRSEFMDLLKEGNEMLLKKVENKLKRSGASAGKTCDGSRENERLITDSNSSGESAGKTGNEARERPNVDLMDLLKDGNVILYGNATTDKLAQFQECLLKYPGIYDKNSNPTAECTLSYVEMNK